MKPVRNKLAGVFLLAMMLNSTLAAEQIVPATGMAAEAAGSWEEAIRIYRQAIEQDPTRADLWVRLSEIHARIDSKAEAAAALEQAVRIAPDNAGYWFRLSQAQAVLDQPAEALDACLHARKLQPARLDVLKTCARQASWAGELDVAHELYSEWLERQPGDTDAQWGMARVDGWAGRLDASAEGYQAYLQASPGNAEAWLEYVQVEIWRGDYGAAHGALDSYQARFGADEQHQRRLARLLARAELPDAAMAVNARLLAAQPRDYELNYTRTLALRAGNQPAEAADSLGILKALRPDSPDTLDMIRFVQTPSRSHARLSVSRYGDSDSVSIGRFGLDGRYVLDNKRTALLVGYDRTWLRADIGSGLETFDGFGRIGVREFWLGAEHRFSPRVLAGARLGAADVQRGDRETTHQLYLDLDPTDRLAIRLENRGAVYDVSPRAVSLQVTENRYLGSFSWRPDLYWFVDGQAGWSDFNDGNEKWQFVLAPRRAVVRHAQFNLDLGVSGEWFGFDRDLNNGYYDPERYRRYAVTAFSYWKIDDDNGISGALSLGWHKDETMPSYEFGGDIVLEGFFGIYRDWFLNVRAGYAERVQTTGSYDGLSFSASLMRRF